MCGNDALQLSCDKGKFIILLHSAKAKLLIPIKRLKVKLIKTITEIIYANKYLADFVDKRMRCSL